MRRHVVNLFNDIEDLTGTPLDSAISVARLQSILDRHLITSGATENPKKAYQIEDFTEGMDKGDDVEIMIKLAPTYNLPATVFKFQRGIWDDVMTHVALNHIMKRYSGEGLLASTKLTSLMRTQDLSHKSILDVCVMQWQSIIEEDKWIQYTAANLTRGWNEYLGLLFSFWEMEMEDKKAELKSVFGNFPKTVDRETSAEFVPRMIDGAERICSWYLSKTTPRSFLDLDFLDTINNMGRFVKVDTSALQRGEVVQRSRLDSTFAPILNDFWNTNTNVELAPQDLYIENKGFLSFSRDEQIATNFAFISGVPQENADGTKSYPSGLDLKKDIPVIYQMLQSDDRQLPAFAMRDSVYAYEQETVIFPACLQVVGVQKKLVKNIWKQDLGTGEQVPALVISLDNAPGSCVGQPVVHW